MTNLFPCPFCGGKAELHEDPYEEWTSYVQCGSCYLRTAEHFRSESAAKYWNTRPSPWIPCAERLPAVDQSVLIHVAYKDGHTCIRHSYRMGDWFCVGGLRLSTDQVTHWMPLPEAPNA